VGFFLPVREIGDQLEQDAEKVDCHAERSEASALSRLNQTNADPLRRSG